MALKAELEMVYRREARDKARDAESGAAGLAATKVQEIARRALQTASDQYKGVADKRINIENKRMELLLICARLVIGVK